MNVQTSLITDLFFLFTTGLTIFLFHLANNRPGKVTLAIIGWTCLHAGPAYVGFYQDTTAFPPRFALILLPVAGMLVFAFTATSRRWVNRRRQPRISPFVHSVRIQVEIILFQLYGVGLAPKIMTFAGWNFDLLFGISALIIGVLYSRKKVDRRGMIIWNAVGLSMILFVFFLGIFSGELPFQLLAFDQPNRAVQFFPYVLLPATIVPVVVYTQLSDILYLKSVKDSASAIHT